MLGDPVRGDARHGRPLGRGLRLRGVAGRRRRPLNLAVAIQHHPSRAALIPELLAGLEGLDVQVVADPGGDRPDTWRSHKACLNAMQTESTHLLVVQDDALPCDRFADCAGAAICEHPEAIVVLFVPGFPFLSRRLEQAHAQGLASVALLPAAFVPTVAIVYPRAHVEGLLAFTDGSRWPNAQRLGRADDAIVAGYTRANRLNVTAVIPCLVEHRDDIPSVSKPSHRAGKHRRAAIFAG